MRRSLLLLKLEHQVRFEELPWIAAIQPYATCGTDTRRAARQTLEQVTWLVLSGFPQAILPNPLIAEMAALARQADLALPLVEEAAAGIFMGTFTQKWQNAAAAASRSLDETLYARYYDLPAPGTWAMPPAGQTAEQSDRWGKRTAAEFAALCATRAAAEAQAPDAPASRVAVNGTILEQAQILTTHNLATLVDALDLREQMTRCQAGSRSRLTAWPTSSRAGVSTQQASPSLPAREGGSLAGRPDRTGLFARAGIRSSA